MIRNFEEITANLTEYETNVLVPTLVKGLENKVGSQNAISNKRICKCLSDKGYGKVTEARVRKCINHIRLKGLVRNLIANSNGYYVATSTEEAHNWSESARERARAIWAVADAVEAQSDGRLFF